MAAHARTAARMFGVLTGVLMVYVLGPVAFAADFVGTTGDDTITGTAAAGPCSALRRTTSAVVAPGTIAPTTTASRKPPIIDKLMRPTQICLADSNRLISPISSSR